MLQSVTICPDRRRSVLQYGCTRRSTAPRKVNQMERGDWRETSRKLQALLTEQQNEVADLRRGIAELADQFERETEGLIGE